jgi:hypothetical protein
MTHDEDLSSRVRAAVAGLVGLLAGLGLGLVGPVDLAVLLGWDVAAAGTPGCPAE